MLMYKRKHEVQGYQFESLIFRATLPKTQSGKNPWSLALHWWGRGRSSWHRNLPGGQKVLLLIQAIKYIDNWVSRKNAEQLTLKCWLLCTFYFLETIYWSPLASQEKKIWHLIPYFIPIFYLICCPFQVWDPDQVHIQDWLLSWQRNVDFEASPGWDHITRPVAFPVEMSLILFTDKK